MKPEIKRIIGEYYNTGIESENKFERIKLDETIAFPAIPTKTPNKNSL